MLGWRRTHKDPFEGEWEQIVSWLVANTERSSGDNTSQGTPPTGKQVSWTEAAIDRIVDGKIVENWINEDALGRLQQIGALPLSGQAS